MIGGPAPRPLPQVILSFDSSTGNIYATGMTAPTIFGYDTGSNDDNLRWFASLGDMGPARLRRLGEQFAADYVLTERNPDLPLPVVYENEMYVVYRLRDGGSR